MNGRQERGRAAPGSEDVNLRVVCGHAAIVLDDIPCAESALDRQIAHAGVDHKVDAIEVIEGAADVIGEGQEVIELSEFCGFHVVERQRLSRIAPEQRVVRHVVHEGVEVGRRERPVDRGLEVAPASPDVIDFHRYSGRDLLRHTRCQIPAVLPCVPAAGGCRIDREIVDLLPEDRIHHRPALAVGRRVQEVAVGHEVAVRVSPIPDPSELMKCPSPAGL